MELLKLLAIVLGVFVVAPVVVFYFFRRKFAKDIEAQKAKGEKLKSMHYVLAAVIVVVMLTLFWFETVGRMWAGITLSAIMFVCYLGVLYVLRNQKKEDKDG